MGSKTRSAKQGPLISNKVRGLGEWRSRTKHSSAKTAAKISYSQPASSNSTRRKALKTSRSVARTAEMFGNVAAMAERRPAPAKCSMLFARNAVQKHRCRSSRAMIARFCAGIASLPAAADFAVSLMFILSGRLRPDFLVCCCRFNKSIWPKIHEILRNGQLFFLKPARRGLSVQYR